MIADSLFVVGHRPNRLWGYNLDIEQYDRLVDEIRNRIEQSGAKEVYTGLDLGCGILTASAVIDLIELGKDIRLHCVCPCKDFDTKWTYRDQENCKMVLERASEVIYISEVYTDDCYLSRCKWFVDNCEKGLVIINSDESLKGSWTETTKAYAEREMRPLSIIDIGRGENKRRRNTSKTEVYGEMTLNNLEAWRDLEHFIVMDTETTGFSFKNGNMIIDIGAFEVMGDKIISKYEQLVNPGVLIPANITELTGIRDVMVANKPDIKTVFPVLVNYVGDKTVLFHNADFDYKKFIKPMYDTMFLGELNWNVLCTLKADRFLRPCAKKHNLETVYRELIGKEMANTHRASTDAFMTTSIAVVMRDFIRSNFDALALRAQHNSEV